MSDMTIEKDSTPIARRNNYFIPKDKPCCQNCVHFADYAAMTFGEIHGWECGYKPEIMRLRGETTPDAPPCSRFKNKWEEEETKRPTTRRFVDAVPTGDASGSRPCADCVFFEPTREECLCGEDPTDPSHCYDFKAK